MEFPKNNKFTYIIGNNGSGKSRALEENAQRLSKDRNIVVIASGATDKFKYGAKVKKTSNGSYLYLGNRTVGNGTHNGSLAANAVLFFLTIIEINLEQQFMQFIEEIGFDKKFGIAYRKTKSSKISQFDTQELTSDFITLNPEILANKSKPFEAVFYKNGTSYRFSDLSSGEQYILTTALKITSSIQNDVCYFIDEPEVSLHVEWQIKWPELFHPLLSLRNGVDCYIATHSPVIISSALQVNADCYNLSNKNLLQIQADEFNVEQILYKNFNTLPPNNKYIFEEIAKVITQTVNNLTDKNLARTNSRNTETLTLGLVDDFKKKIKYTSHTERDTDGIKKILEDFDIAINDLLMMTKHSGAQNSSQEKNA